MSANIPPPPHGGKLLINFGKYKGKEGAGREVSRSHSSRARGDRATTPTFHRSDVQLRPVKKPNGKEPNYRITGETTLGNVEFGAAWKRHSEKGQPFLSVSIDNPAVPGALNAALLNAEDGKTATLVWRRPKKTAKPH